MNWGEHPFVLPPLHPPALPVQGEAGQECWSSWSFPWRNLQISSHRINKSPRCLLTPGWKGSISALCHSSALLWGMPGVGHTAHSRLGNWWKQVQRTRAKQIHIKNRPGTWREKVEEQHSPNIRCYSQCMEALRRSLLRRCWVRARSVLRSWGKDGRGSSRTWWVGKLIPAEPGQTNSSQETVTAALPNPNFTPSVLFLPACVNNNSNFNQENNVLSSEERNCRSGGGKCHLQGVLRLQIQWQVIPDSLQAIQALSLFASGSGICFPDGLPQWILA